MSKSTKIGERIKILRSELKAKSVREMEMGGLPRGKWLISNGLLSKWKGKDIDFASTDLERFLNHYNVNRDWWKTLEGPVFNVEKIEKPTPMPNEAAIQQNTISQDAARLYAELYEKFLGNNSQYLVIHRDVLKEHRLVAVEQFAEDEKRLEKDRADMEQRSKDIQALTDSLREISSRPININFTDIQRTKE